MFRLIGLILGVSLILIPAHLFLGWPDFSARDAPDGAETSRIETVQGMPVLTQIVDRDPAFVIRPSPVAETSGETVPQGPVPTPSPVSPEREESEVDSGAGARSVAEAEPRVTAAPSETAPQPLSEATPAVPAADPPPAADAEPPRTADMAEEVSVDVASADSPPVHGSQLQLLWSPFRTRTAAAGFARRLSKVSGVDVRVAEASPGHYRVGFDYADEMERNWYIGQIQARTGLSLAPATPDDEDENREMAAPAAAAGQPDGRGETR